MVGFARSLAHVRWGECGAPVACLYCLLVTGKRELAQQARRFFGEVGHGEIRAGAANRKE
jgi:hypothetical protein